jgi:hypothetical protein
VIDQPVESPLTDAVQTAIHEVELIMDSLYLSSQVLSSTPEQRARATRTFELAHQTVHALLRLQEALKGSDGRLNA